MGRVPEGAQSLSRLRVLSFRSKVHFCKYFLGFWVCSSCVRPVRICWRTCALHVRRGSTLDVPRAQHPKLTQARGLAMAVGTCPRYHVCLAGILAALGGGGISRGLRLARVTICYLHVPRFRHIHGAHVNTFPRGHAVVLRGCFDQSVYRVRWAMQARLLPASHCLLTFLCCSSRAAPPFCCSGAMPAPSPASLTSPHAPPLTFFFSCFVANPNILPQSPVHAFGRPIVDLLSQVKIQNNVQLCVILRVSHHRRFPRHPVPPLAARPHLCRSGLASMSIPRVRQRLMAAFCFLSRRQPSTRLFPRHCVEDWTSHSLALSPVTRQCPSSPVHNNVARSGHVQTPTSN